MRFRSTAGALRDALGTARGAMASNPSLVAYSGVLLMVKGTSLSVIGSDSETTIAAILEVTDAVNGQVLLPPKPVASFLATLPADADVRVEAEPQGDAEVEAAGAPVYRFRTIAATFPMPSNSKMDMSEVRFERLGEALAAVRAAAGKDEPRVQLVSDGTRLVVNATDTYRIGQASLEGAGFGEFVGVLPLPAAERMARHGIDRVGVDSQGRTLRGTGPGIVIMSRLVKKPFPAVDSVLVDQRPESVTDIGVQDLLAAIRRLEAVADSSAVGVRIEGTEMTLAVANVDLGSGSETIAVSGQVDFPLEFSVNLTYLRDAVDAHPAARVELGYSGTVQPVFLTSRGEMSVTSVVMPVQT